MQSRKELRFHSLFLGEEGRGERAPFEAIPASMYCNRDFFLANSPRPSSGRTLRAFRPLLGCRWMLAKNNPLLLYMPTCKRETWTRDRVTWSDVTLILSRRKGHKLSGYEWRWQIPNLHLNQIWWLCIAPFPGIHVHLKGWHSSISPCNFDTFGQKI